MYKNFLFNQPGMFGLNNMGGFFGFLIFPFIIWSFVWKGLALWKASRKEDKVWFIVFLLVNTLGILEILYIYVFSKEASKKGKKK